MSARVLFVFSADHGEAVNADLFTRGQDFEVGAVLPRGGDAAFAPFARVVGRYGSVDDILVAAADFEADVVVLASAYLLAVNDLLSPAEVISLVSRLKAGGHALATTDPWLGYWHARPSAAFRLPGIAAGAARTRAAGILREHQRDLDAELDDVCHLYAIGYVDAERPSYSFFNALDDGGPVGGDDGPVVLVLSAHDHGVQRRRHGDDFERRLAARVAELAQTRRVVLVAPPACSRAVERAVRSDALDCPGFTGLDDFSRTIAGAGRVVYWNLLSSSLLYAYYARRPIVFADTGHQVELADGLLDRVVAHVYGGRHPAIAALGQADWPGAGERFDRLRDYRGTAPADIVRRLCAGARP